MTPGPGHPAPPRAGLVDLASARLGAAVLAASDEFFAPAGNLLRPEAPVWDPDRYTERGKWMDGWESRRRRRPGHDWCVVRLGAPGTVEQVVVDTAHFRGNHPERVSLDVAVVEGGLAGSPVLGSLERLWTEALPPRPLQGDTTHAFDLERPPTATHVRLAIHPDGGVARLRVLGRARSDVLDALATPHPDLARLDHGGRIVTASDATFSPPHHLLLPSRATGMHDGWETRRRRGPGHDWVVVALGLSGTLSRVEVDTSFFRGNAPATCTLERCEVPAGDATDDEGLARAVAGDALAWTPLLVEAPLRPDDRHVFADALRGERHAALVRFGIHPDGGVARLRVHGEPDAVAALRPGLAALDARPEPEARAALLDCCGSPRVATRLAAARPFGDPHRLLAAADAAWEALGAQAYEEAFDSHPVLGGDTGDGRGRAARWSAAEQASTRGAGDAVLERLAEGNRAYRERFGRTFVLCAAGRRPEEMLAHLEHRLRLDEDAERDLAAAEQRRITARRLVELLSRGDP